MHAPSLATALFTFLLWLTTQTANGQEAPPTETPPAATEPTAEEQIAERIDELDRGIATLRRLGDSMVGIAESEKVALTFQLDARSIAILAEADEIVSAVTSLPDDSEQRTKLVARLAKDFELVGRAVFMRIDELEAEINKRTGELSGSSGTEREFRESYITTLNRTRDQYLETMVNHIESRRALGMSDADLLPPLETRLLLQGESLSGKINFLATSLEDVNERLKIDSSNADLQAVQKDSTDLLAKNLDRLRLIVDMLNRLGLNTTDYRSTLAQHSKGISLDLIQPGVLQKLMTEWTESLQDFFRTQGPVILLNALLFIVVILTFRVLSRLTRRAIQAGLDRSKLDLSTLLKDTLVSIAGGTVMLVGILMALSQIGISLGPMLAGLGIAGFIVGFALQETLANFAAGAMILIYRPYDVDDFVEVTGASGEVKRMNLVSTTITTFDNQTMVVPNGKIWGDVIKNVTGQRTRRVDLEFGISYTDDIDKAMAVLKELAEAHELTLKSPATLIKVHSLGDSSVNIILRPWVKTADYWTVYWDLMKQVKQRFDVEGISIPFPQRDVHLYSTDGASTDSP